MSRIVRVLVVGKVQGVGYRAWVEREAKARGLHGWVRNRRNGNVEAVFAGEDATVAAMIAACHHGPANARVSSVQTTEETAQPNPAFSIFPTA